jgi:hypothetical protein
MSERVITQLEMKDWAMRALLAIGAVAITIVVAVTGWVLVQVVGIDKEVAVHREKLETLNARLTNIESKLDVIGARLQPRVPPQP